MIPQSFGFADGIGVFDSVTDLFYLRNTASTGFADYTFRFGSGGDNYPIAGDWTGQGYDTIGIYNRVTSEFYLRNSNTTGYADFTFSFGTANADPYSRRPVAGRWQPGATHDGIGFFVTAQG